VSQQLTIRIFMRHACLILLLAVASATRPDSQLLAAEPTLEQLKADLRSSDAKVRRKAASELGKTKSHEAVQPLLSAASDRDISVREEVVKSLGLLKDPEALTMLLTTIKDPAESVREESIIALVNLYADRDANWVVTRTAKKVYKTINPFSDQVGDDATVIEAYVQVAPMVIDSIAERLLDSSPAVRLDAAKALGVLRARPAVPKMIDAMKTGDANLRIAVLRSLYKIRDTSTDEQILPYLNDSNKNVRDETILTLGLFRSKKALPDLKRIYDQNPDTKLRLKAFEALALIGDESTLDLFKRNLKDTDKAYRQAAAEGIGRVGNASLVEDVSRTFLNEKDMGAQIAQSFALYRLGRKEFLDKLLMGLAERMYHQQATTYLVEMGAPVVPDLVRNLNHENAVVREKLCAVLGLIGDSSTIEQLKPLLRDSNQSVASEAALAIRRLGANS
jgi:HEAT repeat protein